VSCCKSHKLLDIDAAVLVAVELGEEVLSRYLFVHHVFGEAFDDLFDALRERADCHFTGAGSWLLCCLAVILSISRIDSPRVDNNLDEVDGVRVFFPGAVCLLSLAFTLASLAAPVGSLCALRLKEARNDVEVASSEVVSVLLAQISQLLHLNSLTMDLAREYLPQVELTVDEERTKGVHCIGWLW